jgi:predicted transcriptional regulator
MSPIAPHEDLYRHKVLAFTNVPIKFHHRDLTRLEMMRHEVRQMETRKVTEQQRPIPTRASKAQVHAFAEHVATQLQFRPGDTLEPVVARLGGKIAFQSPLATGEQLPESIVIESMRAFTIYISSTTSPQRDRFTIAHELGHLFLHYQMVQKSHPGSVMVATRWIDPNDAEQQRAEWEANWFAAAFLMPVEAFRNAWTAHTGEVSFVARTFGVSDQAASVRAKSLALA